MAKSPLEEPSTAYAPFDAEDTRRLRTYTEDVATLASSAFFKELRLTVTVGEPGVGDTLEAPDDEAVRAIVGVFRSLYTDSNDTSFKAIMKLLSRHTHERQSPVRDTAVDHLRRIIKSKDEALKAGIVTFSETTQQALTPEVLVVTFINGHYLHKDEKRMAVLSGLRDDAVIRFEFLSTLQRLSRVFAVGNKAVECVLNTPGLLPAP